MFFFFYIHGKKKCPSFVWVGLYSILYSEICGFFYQSDSVCTKIENLDASYLFCNLKLQTVAINFMRNMLELNFLVIF